MPSRCLFFINPAAGSLNGKDAQSVLDSIVSHFARAGWEGDGRLVPPADLGAFLDEIAGRNDLDLVVAGGGDGTLAGFVSKFAHTQTPIACLPLGTMNLFCRSLAIPDDLDRACDAIAAGAVRPVDIGDINGHHFLFHASIGLQPLTVMYRQSANYEGRLGKMFATVRAFWKCLRKAKPLSVQLSGGVDNETLDSPAISIIANPFRPTAFGLSRQLNVGRLGLYAATSSRRIDIIRVTMKALLFSRPDDDHYLAREMEQITLSEKKPSRKGIKVSLDGELTSLESPIEARCIPNAVNMLLPQ